MRHLRPALRALLALSRPRHAVAFLALLLATAHAANAATPVHTVTRDLRPLIRAAAASPVQFAVDVPYAASTKSDGSWSSSGGQATWHYAVRIPTAVSLSFHALHIQLPGSAILTVRGSSTTVVYRGRDLRGPGLWSRIQPGDTLELTLEVSAAERSAVRLDIVSLQAGYRSMGAGVPDHPFYRSLQKAQTADTANSSCAQNYECSVTTANTPAAQATVGLVIENLFQCSGTLINDVTQDNSPYVLTARHCETGRLGGGNPGAAAGVTVYWDAVTPCGSTLAPLYDPGVKTQTGATTIIEQQDAWLIRLDDSPVVSDAELAGLDATGDAVQGGYTIHHALSLDKQFTTWFGTAFAVDDSGVLNVSYASNFWETVNATGNIGPGASGSGLFNQNDVLVGSLTLGRQGDSSGYGSCPNPTPSAPNGSNGVADFTQLAAVWNSLADTTSSTLPATFQSVLDPQNTGTKLVSSVPAASMSFSASTYSLPVQSAIVLTWNAPGATQCTAGGGSAGDGWQGTLAASGSQQVTESVANDVIYRLACQLPGARTVTSSLTVTWGTLQPELNFTGSVAAWTTTPAMLTWTSNLAPCSINGGSLSVGNLPSSGSITTTQATTGDVQYQILCGSSTQNETTGWNVSYVTPSVQFTASGTDRQLGQPLTLSWITFAQSCTPSGGAPNDGWASTNYFNPQSKQSFSPNVTTLGTYTYTLACTAGTLSVSQSVTVTVENNPGYVTLNVSPTTVTYSDSPADEITLDWNSNLTNCNPTSQPLTGGFIVPELSAQGTATWPPPAPGTYTLTVTCAPYDTTVGSVTSTPVTVTVQPPPNPTATLSISPATVQVGQNFTVTWTSTGARVCSATGDNPPGFPWLSQQLLLSGSRTVTAQGNGQYTLGIDCPSIASGVPDATAQATLTVTPAAPSATLSVSSSALQVGQSLTLTWSSANATACSAAGGGADGSSWSGNLATSGTITQTATTAGSFTYTLTCTNGTESSNATATVAVSSSSTGSGSSSSGAGGGKGGGGAISVLDLLALAGVLWFRIGGRPAPRPRQ